MTSLLDIVPATEKVRVASGGKTLTIECSGITVAGVAVLLGRFPALREMMSGSGVATDPQSLVATAPEAVAAILAAGTGHAGDAAHEAAAGLLPVDTQLDLLAAIMRLTLPQGIGPFVEKLTGLFGVVGEGVPLPNGKAPDTSLPLQPNI
jgi:hypothetical protein